MLLERAVTHSHTSTGLRGFWPEGFDVIRLLKPPGMREHDLKNLQSLDLADTS